MNKDKADARETMKPKYKIGDVLYYIKHYADDVFFILEVPVRFVYIGKTTISYGLAVGRFGLVARVRQDSKQLFSTREEAEARVAELQKKWRKPK